MKRKLFALVAAVCLLAMTVPALAFTGAGTDPGLPAIDTIDNSPFTINVKRVENDPVITENQWGEEIYAWTDMANASAVSVGDVVTLACELAVPATLDGYTAEQLEAIEVLFTANGLEGVELVRATGCEANFECDFEAGYCYPLPGYGNAAVRGNTLTVDANLDSNVQVIIRGTATQTYFNVDVQCTIGQYAVPAFFSCGTLEKHVADNGAVVYDVHFKDTFNVQLVGMKFFAVDGAAQGFYVCRNNHDYVRSVTPTGVSYTEVVDGVETGDPITSGTVFNSLETSYNTYMSFFRFTDDDINDVMTDGVFLRDCEAARYSTAFAIGVEGEEPAPNPPVTGMISFAAIGFAAVIGGLGAIALRKRSM